MHFYDLYSVYLIVSLIAHMVQLIGVQVFRPVVVLTLRLLIKAVGGVMFE